MRIKQEMKKFIVILAACVLLGLAACGDATAERETDVQRKSVAEETLTPTPRQEPTITPVVTPEPTAMTEPTLTLEALQSEALAGGNLCAAAYLGYMEEGYPEFMTFLEDSGLLAQFPFLSEIKEENTVLASGGEWYVLVLMEKGLTLTVSEAVLDETTYALVAGRELLQTEAGQPLLLRGNVSDIFPSFIVTMSGPDGTELDYAPGLSLRDGALLQKEGVYDFTVYAEGQLEED